MAKTVFITGASSGIGEATAQLFLAKNWNVVATARTPASVVDLQSSPNALVLPLDVTNESSVAIAVEEAIGRFNSIDVLVNNAGIGLAGPLEAVSASDLEAQFATNVFGVARVTRAFIAHFRAAKSGTIVNVSSIVGRFGVPFLAPYCASKFALEGLSEALRYELFPLGIRVKLVEPGGIKTSFKQQWTEHAGYEPYLKNVKTMMEKADATLPGPGKVAEAIFRAANDMSGKLRYSASAGPYLALHSILPDAIWQRLLRQSLGKA